MYVDIDTGPLELTGLRLTFDTIGYSSKRYLYFSNGRSVSFQFQKWAVVNSSNTLISYLVTELMATDLQTLLKTKKVDNQFTQYFMYQIMVRSLTSTP